MIRLLVIVGQEKDDLAEPFVIGAFNHDLMIELPLEDYDEQINKLKGTWTGDPSWYDWRELIVEIPDEAVEDLFKIPRIEGKIISE